MLGPDFNDHRSLAHLGSNRQQPALETQGRFEAFEVRHVKPGDHDSIPLVGTKVGDPIGTLIQPSQVHDEQIGTRATAQRVAAGAGIDRVVTLSTRDLVFARAAKQPIVARTALQNVIPCIASENVVSGEATKAVSTGSAGHRVGSIAPLEHVVSRAAVEWRGPAVRSTRHQAGRETHQDQEKRSHSLLGGSDEASARARGPSFADRRNTEGLFFEVVSVFQTSWTASRTWFHWTTQRTTTRRPRVYAERTMEASAPSAIEIVERAYDLSAPTADWLPTLIDAAAELLDRGGGAIGGLWSGADEKGLPLVTHVATRFPDLATRYARFAQVAGPEKIARTCRAVAGSVNLMSETRRIWPDVHNLLAEHLDCRDVLTLFAVDPDLFGAVITAPSPGFIDLNPQVREQLNRIGVHITAGARLRRASWDTALPAGTPLTDVPLDSEALLDPKRFRVSEAFGPAKDRAALETIRDAAIRVDRARGHLRRTDPERALDVWQGLVRGRWSLVDWFDTDGRRFVLAKPNAPNLGDPRGLTEREHQVATYAARGESSKLIGYRFGVSPSRVSVLMRSAFRKLGVRTQAELIGRMRGMPEGPA